MGVSKALIEPPDPGSGGKTVQLQLGEKMQQRLAFHPSLDDDGKILDNGKEAR